ncbi:TetR/AcrR family transcriptional regulator [Occultella gossypii]|uniref:TetR/AcrR family transcriptional regulator n=1 Tax=Occultella gossypii TaxID=2800820 RepID=A0ABS7SC55_9MICO|nr:TetR/AcrR family transcriptional regulator [Occultella gossypii]MBZ2197931.1 TetR/AcrR family transcriptional regulator [Occultella gossypii]
MADTEERAQTSRSAQRRAAMLAAAQEAFLRDGYLGTNMDEIATASKVSKQTVYKHFGSKEALFVEIVTSMTVRAGDGVHDAPPDVRDTEQLTDYLRDYALRQLMSVLTPQVVQVRRLVIGEAARFPELARALYDHGPQRALDSMTDVFARLSADGLLRVDDPRLAAEQFNWLIMSGPVNRAMLLGDDAIPARAELRRHAENTARLIVAAYRPA